MSRRGWRALRGRRFVLYLQVFLGGATTMGLEMCASRLLAPYFGDSLPVWGLLIGLLLAYLSIGYVLGGWLADRYPRASLPYRLTAWAGFAAGLTPYLARPILRYAASAFGNYQAGAVLAALIGILALFAVPVVLLGCVSPFAVRLSIEDTGSSGNVAGRIYALSTVGSLFGTFIPVFLLIPYLGTRRAIITISLSLLAVAVVGLLQTDRRRALFYLLLPLSILVLQWLPTGAVKPTDGMIYETESAYNYIQVITSGQEVLLKLNEGEGIQSSYHPANLLSGYVYDYFLLAPYFRDRQAVERGVDSMCLIGLAGGTIARQYAEVFGAPSIDGIEIDPAIVRVSQRFFGLDLPNLQVIVEDGRYYLGRTSRTYDVVIIDAYRPPYIPFQLTTVEFFRLVRDHLKPDGVVAINVARTETDYALVDAIASTLKAVYPSVFIIDTRSDLNSVVVATYQATDLSSLDAGLDGVSQPVVQDVVSRAKGGLREFAAPTRDALTDDHAPVEQIVHAVAIRYLLGQPVQEGRP